MFDEKFVLMINISKLIAVNEYLRERVDKYVCIVLDGIVNGLQDVLLNLEQK